MLFRKLFKPSIVYYDLQPAENEYFQSLAHNESKLNEALKGSNDPLIKEYSNGKKQIDLNQWKTLNGEFYKCEFGAVMVENGALFISSEEKKGIYEFTGSFEIFSLDKKVC